MESILTLPAQPGPHSMATSTRAVERRHPGLEVIDVRAEPRAQLREHERLEEEVYRVRNVVPVIVTAVPTGPLVGVNDVMAGVTLKLVALVPVPLAPRRLRQRGYNQSEMLARALARRWELPLASVLIRRRETPSQTALTPEARRANVAGAFEMSNVQCPMINDQWALDIEHSTLIIVDDVFTTGATLAECARALAGAGATDVRAVTFARAVIPDFN